MDKQIEIETYNMFNCDKVNCWMRWFFTPMSRSGAFFFALAPSLKFVFYSVTEGVFIFSKQGHMYAKV